MERAIGLRPLRRSINLLHRPRRPDLRQTRLLPRQRAGCRSFCSLRPRRFCSLGTASERGYAGTGAGGEGAGEEDLVVGAGNRQVVSVLCRRDERVCRFLFLRFDDSSVLCFGQRYRSRSFLCVCAGALAQESLLRHGVLEQVFTVRSGFLRFFRSISPVSSVSQELRPWVCSFSQSLCTCSAYRDFQQYIWFLFSRCVPSVG